MPLQSALDLPDRSTCTCSCFDNRYKQGNPSLGLYPNYKTLYFNFDERISTILAWCVVCFVVAGAGCRTILAHMISGERHAYWALSLIVLSIYPLFYNFWSIFNYVNEGSSRMIKTQLFYGVTDMIVGAIAVSHLDAQKQQPHPVAYLMIIVISLVHIISNLSFLGANANPKLGLVIMWYSDVLTLVIGAFRIFIMARKGETVLRISSLWKSPREALEFILRRGERGAGKESERGEERGSEKNLADEDDIDDHKEKTLQKVYCVKDLLGDILRVIVLSIFGILFIRNACLWSRDEC